MSVAEVSGYVAAVLVFMTFYMKTMIPLRIVGICSRSDAWGLIRAVQMPDESDVLPKSRN
jgi:hypothetical protein